MTERQIANTAKSKLQNDLLAKIGRQLQERTGDASNKTNVKARFSQNQLKRIVIDAPKYVFIQNYGFEGNKRNTVHMRLKAKRTIDDAIKDTDIMNYLADHISELRADDIVAVFGKR
ncbi:hypothetical protein [Myroides odoratus]|uniref:hypothetical protein n=1 Tax=Myroides odoratus TaxID=256 RepID=UPI003340F60B